MNQISLGIPTRRVVLGTGLAVGSVATLVACGGGSKTDPLPQATGTATEAGPVSALPVGGSSSLAVSGRNYLFYRPDETTVLAYTSICTHQGCTVGVTKELFKCPCHGSEYSHDDGSVIQGPAPKPLTRYAAEIKDGKILIYL